jgi:endogenous inhibitor of DNA gyrase (YacG/DUF329 family)
MGVMMITCPNTGRPVTTGIETDNSTFRDLPDTMSKVRCPQCGAQHVWWTREAWLAADGDGDMPRMVIAPFIRKARAAG